jgi:quercetin dioxygenase-like cupin family protein
VGSAPTAFEAWNDYDPSMRFLTAFPVSAAQGTTNSTVAYYEFEPGRHSGLHSDNAEETIYVADGEGEVFVSGIQEPLQAGGFVFIEAGVQHDVYAYGDVPLRLLSFFPTKTLESTFTEIVLPFGGYLITSEGIPSPQFEELSPENLPPELAEAMGYDFDLGEADMLGGPAAGAPAEEQEQQEEPEPPEEPVEDSQK